jgi:hypothetical protein
MKPFASTSYMSSSAPLAVTTVTGRLPYQTLPAAIYQPLGFPYQAIEYLDYEESIILLIIQNIIM